MSGTENLFPTLEARESAALPQKLALELQSGLMVCAAVNAAVQLGLPDLLAQPISVTQVAKAQEWHEPSLLILLRALSSIGIFTEITPETFGPTERSTLLRKEGMAALVRLWGAPYQWDSWKHLAHTIKTGRPGLEVTAGEGTTIWTYLSGHPEEAVIFQQGLAANARLVLPVLLASYDFSGIKTLADMGGGFGELGMELLSAYPTMEITLFDRQEVIEQVMAYGISPQIQLTAGDFFLDPPAHMDAYVFKNVLMDWGDQEYVRIVRQCATVLAPGGCLLIVEPVLTDATPFTRFFSLQMALMMRHAHHRTLEEHRALLHQAGLTLTRVEPLGLEQMVIECRLSAPQEDAR